LRDAPWRARLAGGLLAALIATGCTKVETQNAAAPGSNAARNPWTNPARLVIGEGQDAKSLNPMLATSAMTLDLSMFVFSYAVRYDEKARPVPDALREVPTLENGDVSRDGLTLKYKLRPNMTWHDGEAVTCRDLAFTWKAVMNPHNNVVTTDGYKDIASIDCSDPLVAVVHMKKVYAPYLQQLWGVNGNAPILPAHLLEKLNDDKGSFNTAPYQGQPVGSGPYKVVAWQRGAEIKLEANDRYYLGAPKIRTVLFKIFPDENTLVAQLRTHEIDLAVHLSGSLWPQVQNIPGMIAEAVPVFTFDHLDFNLRKPLFADVALRRALEQGVNKREILEKIDHGLGDVSDVPQSPRISWTYAADTAHFDYDPAKAKARLDALGWKAGPDGIRVKDGRRLAFTYATATEGMGGRAIEVLVQRQWHDIGADVSVKNVPTAQMYDNTANGTLQGGHYDVASFAWGGAADPDDSAIYSAHNFAPHGQNALFWDDPLATKAMDDGLATVDPARRKAFSQIEQRRFASDVPSIVLFFRREPLVRNSDLAGYATSPVISPFWNPHAYSLSP
jgi:peptide/nickel transport system substrate-binding protein